MSAFSVKAPQASTIFSNEDLRFPFLRKSSWLGPGFEVVTSGSSTINSGELKVGAYFLEQGWRNCTNLLTKWFRFLSMDHIISTTQWPQSESICNIALFQMYSDHPVERGKLMDTLFPSSLSCLFFWIKFRHQRREELNLVVSPACRKIPASPSSCRVQSKFPSLMESWEEVELLFIWRNACWRHSTLLFRSQVKTSPFSWL